MVWDRCLQEGAAVGNAFWCLIGHVNSDCNRLRWSTFEDPQATHQSLFSQHMSSRHFKNGQLSREGRVLDAETVAAWISEKVKDDAKKSADQAARNRERHRSATASNSSRQASGNSVSSQDTSRCEEKTGGENPRGGRETTIETDAGGVTAAGCDVFPVESTHAGRAVSDGI